MLLLPLLTPALVPAMRHTGRVDARRAGVPRMSVIAVDLNGVIVDSQDECTRSAWIAACELWPDAMAVAGDDALSANPWRAGARRAWADGEWDTLKGVGDDGIPNWLDAKLRLLRPIFDDGSDVRRGL